MHTDAKYSPFTPKLKFFGSLILVNSATGFKFYNLSFGKTLPEWLSEKKKESLRYNQEYRKRIELLQDAYFPIASQRIKASADGRYIIATGTYPPQVKVFEVSQLSMKFERHLDCEVTQFQVGSGRLLILTPKQVLSEDFSKMVFLHTDRTVEFHAKYGTYFKTRIPKVSLSLSFLSLSLSLSLFSFKNIVLLFTQVIAEKSQVWEGHVISLSELWSLFCWEWEWTISIKLGSRPVSCASARQFARFQCTCTRILLQSTKLFPPGVWDLGYSFFTGIWWRERLGGVFWSSNQEICRAAINDNRLGKAAWLVGILSALQLITSHPLQGRGRTGYSTTIWQRQWATNGDWQ